MLSKTELWDIFTGAKKPGMREGEADDAGLRAVAEAAVKDAVGGEVVAWLHNLENFQEPRMRPLDENEISRGWTQKPLYTRPQASAAVPDVLISEAEMASLRRFSETTEDDGSYDIPHGMVRRLCDIGVLSWRGHHRYRVTDFGDAMLAASQPEVKS